MSSEKFPTAQPYLPSRMSLESLKKASKHCEGCDLFKNATQTVFGEGSRNAEIVLIGEQPGDHEDQEGHPFVGPAGRMLDQILESAGIDRSLTYVTNAVKHFKFARSGKRRIHQKPNSAELHACHPWLEAELKILKPKIVVCLGATAARAAFGKIITIGTHRGRFHRTLLSDRTFVTVHPSSILRMPDHHERLLATHEMTRDFKKIYRELQRLSTEYQIDTAF